MSSYLKFVFLAFVIALGAATYIPFINYEFSMDRFSAIFVTDFLPLFGYIFFGLTVVLTPIIGLLFSIFLLMRNGFNRTTLAEIRVPLLLSISVIGMAGFILYRNFGFGTAG